jgi:hypothetical protein
LDVSAVCSRAALGRALDDPADVASAWRTVRFADRRTAVGERIGQLANINQSGIQSNANATQFNPMQYACVAPNLIRRFDLHWDSSQKNPFSFFESTSCRTRALLKRRSDSFVFADMASDVRAASQLVRRVALSQRSDHTH